MLYLYSSILGTLRKARESAQKEVVLFNISK